MRADTEIHKLTAKQTAGRVWLLAVPEKLSLQTARYKLHGRGVKPNLACHVQ